MLCCLITLVSILSISSRLTLRPSIRLVTIRKYDTIPASTPDPSCGLPDFFSACFSSSFGRLLLSDTGLVLLRLPFWILFLNLPSFVR
jgi:hypothetical protein